MTARPWFLHLDFAGEPMREGQFREPYPMEEEASMTDDLQRPRPFCDWYEERGDVLWWRIPISESPYIGSPLNLGRTASISLQVGLELIEDVVVGMVGGWPFDEEDERHLWWTPLPDAKRIEDQVPL